MPDNAATAGRDFPVVDIAEHCMCDRKPLANINEISEYLGVPVGTIHQWSSRGGGPRLIKVGRHLKARWSDLDAYLNAHTVGAA